MNGITKNLHTERQ